MALLKQHSPHSSIRSISFNAKGFRKIRHSQVRCRHQGSFKSAESFTVGRRPNIQGIFSEQRCERLGNNGKMLNKSPIVTSQAQKTP
jgi:hypothetical protein